MLKTLKLHQLAVRRKINSACKTSILSPKITVLPERRSLTYLVGGKVRNPGWKYFWKVLDDADRLRKKIYWPLYAFNCMYLCIPQFTFRLTAWDLTRSITNKSKGAKSGQLLSKNYFCHTSCYRTISCVVIKTGH